MSNGRNNTKIEMNDAQNAYQNLNASQPNGH